MPGWIAVMEQVPPATIVTVVPVTVQTDVVVELKLTVKPELAVALIVNGAVPAGTFDSVLKVIVCACSTENDWVTGVAAV